VPARGEPVGDFAKGGLDRLFVLRDADVLADLRGIEVRPQRAAFEDRTLIEGEKAQARDPAPNNPPRVALAVPKLPVRLMLGKNAARAAPISAFSERSNASAWRISGRCVSRSTAARPECRPESSALPSAKLAADPRGAARRSAAPGRSRLARELVPARRNWRSPAPPPIEPAGG